MTNEYTPDTHPEEDLNVEFSNEDITNFNLSYIKGSAEFRAMIKPLLNVSLISPEKEIEYAKKIAQGDQSVLEQFVSANTRLVLSFINKFLTKYNIKLSSNDQYEDLFQAGMQGVTDAALRFDPRQGARFSTYATTYILKHVREELNPIIKVSPKDLSLASKLRHLTDSLTKEYGKVPTDDELATKMEITLKKVRYLKSLNVTPDSLDKPVGDGDNDGTAGEFIKDDTLPTPEKAAEDSALAENFSKILSEVLDPRELIIIRHRFGIGCEPLQLDVICKKIGLTFERARQIEVRAIKKIRNSDKCKFLHDFL